VVSRVSISRRHQTSGNYRDYGGYESRKDYDYYKSTRYSPLFFLLFFHRNGYSATSSPSPVRIESGLRGFFKHSGVACLSVHHMINTMNFFHSGIGIPECHMMREIQFPHQLKRILVLILYYLTSVSQKFFQTTLLPAVVKDYFIQSFSGLRFGMEFGIT